MKQNCFPSLVEGNLYVEELIKAPSQGPFENCLENMHWKQKQKKN